MLNADEQQALRLTLTSIMRAGRPEWLTGDVAWEDMHLVWRFGFIIGVTIPYRQYTLRALVGLRGLKELHLRSTELGDGAARALATSVAFVRSRY